MGFFDFLKKKKTETVEIKEEPVENENVSYEIKGNDQIIYLIGDINSNNASAVEQKIDSILADGKKIIFDCVNLNYISSAGLRVLLRLRKTHDELRVINVKPDVYEVFEMTGFTKIMTVEKAYKVLSVKGCEVIGRGANGVVYRYDPETVIKVYKNAGDLDDIIHEREVAREALILGIPTALSYDVVKVDDSYASVFELINAKSLTNLIQEDPNNISAAVDLSVNLLHQIHDIEEKEDKLPHIKDKALKWDEYLKKELDEADLEKLMGLIKDIPDSLHIIHGDYHTKNIMLQDGEAIMIDMDTLSVGDAIFEFSQLYLSYRAFGELDHKCVEDFLELSWDQAQYLLEETIKRYFKLDDISSYLDKCALLAYAKLLRRHIKRGQGSQEEREFLKKRIKELLPKVDKLY